MIFSSIPFLYYFLPLALLLCYLVPSRARNAFLLLASLVFYAWGEPKYLPVMAAATALGYGFGLAIERFRRFRKPLLVLSIVSSLGFLLYFKYADFFLENLNAMGLNIPLLRLALPVGISFYTFQILSYTVDVYRGEVRAQRNPIDLACYVTFFPQLIAGPIVRYKDIAAQLRDRPQNLDNLRLGTGRFLVGLGKKVLLANLLGEVCAAWRVTADPSVLFSWLYAISYTLHIYFDFSGYSDMAIGLGKLFGFSFPENFNYPYTAASVTEFWRRWHISLTTWFREYLYIPLGGSRKGTWRTVRNIFLVWFCTGFWHGASWNFILWGLHFFGWLMLEKYLLRDFLQKLPSWLRHFYTLVVVFVGWGVFAMEDLTVCVRYFKTCFGSGTLWSAADGYYLIAYGLTLLLLTVGSTRLPRKVWDRLPERTRDLLGPLLMTAGLVICTAYLVDGSYNPFLYFRF